MKLNPLHAIDFYKSGHYRMYTEGTSYIYSNFTPRSDKHARESGKVADDFDGKVVFFGLQGIIQWYLIDLWNQEFFLKPKKEVLAKYKRRMDKALGEGIVGLEHIEELHDLGFMPVRIKALPEGSRVPMRVPVMTIINTDPRFFWLTNYLETALSAEMWKVYTNATIAYEFRRVLERFAEETGSPKDFIDWQGHDFAYRGMSGLYDGAQNNSGHLLSFYGTDTVTALDYLEDYYGATDSFTGGSVPATEHSVACLDGEEGEFELFQRLIQDLYPSGIISLVSDGFDFFRVISEYAPKLKDVILNRTPNSLGLAKVVFRPDSGDPVEILCGVEVQKLSGAHNLDQASRWAGEIVREIVFEETPHGECGEDTKEMLFRFQDKIYKAVVQIDWNRHDKQYYYIDGYRTRSFEEVELTPEQKGAVECLWDTFGGTVTDKGYKVLHERVGLIYGDSITIPRMTEILRRLKDKGFASCNSVFGIGSYTYNMSSRDLFGFAMKATWALVKDEPRSIFKNPKTDSGTKKSAKGLLKVDIDDKGEYTLIDNISQMEEMEGCLSTVFENGSLIKFQTYDEIRTRLHSS